MSNTIPIVMSLLFNLNFNLTLIKKEKYNKEKVLDVFPAFLLKGIGYMKEQVVLQQRNKTNMHAL